MEITHEEYLKAQEIIERYKYQIAPKTIYITVTYNATVTVDVRVPEGMSIDEIKQELEGGYHHLDQEDEAETTLNEITELIVDGDVVEL